MTRRVTNDDRVVEALHELGGIGQRNVPIGPMTTYRVGGPAAVFVEPATIDQLRCVRRARDRSELPIVVLGRGSNTLVADGGIEAIVVSTARLHNSIDVDPPSCEVIAGSSVLLPVLARRTASLGLTGLEWAVGVPGSVGGAVRMNAGGHGSDIAATLVDVDVADLAAPDDTSMFRAVAADRLQLGFRSSALGDAEVVVAARFALGPGDRAEAEQQIADIVSWRRANQPGGQNAGSVFVNPVPGEVSAGALIDQIGMRGARLGSATVSAKHANFIQADEGGSADDVRALMDVVAQRVAVATGFSLRSEIRLLGFDR
jgi:UDP-N-acetylmuramate dehydrogenase